MITPSTAKPSGIGMLNPHSRFVPLIGQTVA